MCNFWQAFFLSVSSLIEETFAKHLLRVFKNVTSINGTMNSNLIFACPSFLCLYHRFSSRQTTRWTNQTKTTSGGSPAWRRWRKRSFAWGSPFDLCASGSKPIRISSAHPLIGSASALESTQRTLVDDGDVPQPNSLYRRIHEVNAGRFFFPPAVNQWFQITESVAIKDMVIGMVLIS